MDRRFVSEWMDMLKLLAEANASTSEQSVPVDITVVAEGRFVQVHRDILATWSPLFHEMFLANNPSYISMDRVKYSVLLKLVQYMYLGFVNMQIEEVHDFVQTISFLQMPQGILVMNGNWATIESPGSYYIRMRGDAAPQTAQNVQVPRAGRSNDVTTNGRYSVANSLPRGNVAPHHNMRRPRGGASQPRLSFNHTPVTFAIIQQLKSYGGIKYVMNRSYNAQLLHKGFLYNRTVTNRIGQTTWRCCDNGKLKCKAVIATDGQKFVVRREHCHPDHYDKIIGRYLYDTAEAVRRSH